MAATGGTRYIEDLSIEGWKWTTSLAIEMKGEEDAE